MALTNEKTNLTSFQLFLELAQAFKDLGKVDVEKLVKETYALTDTEKAKYEEAKSKISYYEGLKKEIAAQQNALEVASNDLDKKNKANAEFSKSLDARESAVRKKEETQTEAAMTLKDRESTLILREEAVKTAESKAKANLEASTKAKEESEELRTELKTKLEAISKL